MFLLSSPVVKRRSPAGPSDEASRSQPSSSSRLRKMLSSGVSRSVWYTLFCALSTEMLSSTNDLPFCFCTMLSMGAAVPMSICHPPCTASCPLLSVVTRTMLPPLVL